MRYVLLILILGAFLPFASIAEEGEVEKFDVVGSHIKKTTTEGASPVLVIDREQIEMSGYNSLSDVLRDLPVASHGGQAEAALEYPSSQSGTSLRGMRGRDVLILMNYRRLPPVGGSNSVDLNAIPLSVIDKIEILKDGASALYGSDAVGGVINIITKKGDNVGGQVNVQGSLTQREEGNTGSALLSFVDFWNMNDEDELNAWNGKGDKFSIDASYGGSENDINYMIGGQLRLNSAMYLKDRKFSAISVDDYSPFGNPGSWLDGAEAKPFPGCPSERIKEGICKWDYSAYMQSTPRIMQGSVFGYMDTELNSSLRTSATVMYSYLNSLSVLAPPPLVELYTGGVPVGIAKKWKLPVQGTDDVKVFYRPVKEAGVGKRKFSLSNHSYQAQFNLTQDLLNTMELEGNLNLSGSHYITKSSGFLSRNKLFKLTEQGKFDPTKPDDEKSDLSEAAVEQTKETHSNLFSFEPKLSGELGEIADQPLFFAIGGLGAWQRYLEEGDEETKKLIDSGDQILGGDVVVDGEGSRTFGSLYGELSLLAFEMLDLQLASRMDYYYYSESETATGLTEQIVPFTDDVTMPLSPRLALTFQPIDEVKLRASWGMGFRAPSLTTIHQQETTTHPFAIDYTKCPRDQYAEKVAEDKKNETTNCTRTQHVLKLSGNEELEPETFSSFNLGIIFQPIEQLSFTVDYFRTNRENLIIFYNDSPSLDASLQDVIDYAQQKGENAKKALKAHGINIEQDETGKISQITAKPLNSAHDLVHGVDLELDVSSIPLAEGWDLGLSVTHSHTLYNEYQVFSDSRLEVPIPWYEWLGFDNYGESSWPGMPRWRNTAVLSVMNKDLGHTIQLIVHNIPSQLKLRESKEEIDHYWQLDLAGKFALGENTDLTVGIVNVLGSERPENNLRSTATGYLDSYLYSVRGRMLNARLTYNFQ